MASSDRNAKGKATDRALHKWIPEAKNRALCTTAGDAVADDSEVSCRRCLRRMAKQTEPSVRS